MTNYSNIAVETTITGAIGAGDTSLVVANATGYPLAPFRIVIDPGSAVSEEVCQVTNVAGTTFTITRGYDGTTAKSHASGAAVIHALVASDITDLQAADAAHAALTTGAHGGIVASNDSRLFDSRTPSGSAGGVLSGTYPNPGFAVDMATQTELDAEASARSNADALLAPLASPALTGTPTAPTAVNATSSTQLATTAFVHALITDLINASPAALDTLKELADAIGDDPNFATTVTTSIATKLAKASNLSDLTDASAARTNLGLGALAVLSTITASLISDASANGRSLITAANYSAMRTLLSLVIGTNVQAWDADLDAIAALASAADKLPYAIGAQAWALTTLTGFIRTLLDDTDAATARATLGAQTAIPLGRPKTGSTYGFVIPGVEATGAATAVLTANQVRYEPFYVATQITIDQLALEVTSTGGAGKLVRVGIYNADTDLQPTSLVYDAGTIAADSVTAQTITLGVAQTLAPGRYLFAINSDGTPTMRCLRAGSMLSGFSSAFGASPFVVSLTAAQTFGAFPGTGLAWTALNTGGGSPAVHCVIARVSTP